MARAEILANGDEGGGNWRLRLRPPRWPGAAPGQFLMLGTAAGPTPRSDPLLPRPMAVFRSGTQGGLPWVEVLYRVVGRGTALLAACRPGQRLPCLGPLGASFAAPPSAGGALLVGGGTGIASLYQLAADCAERSRGRVHVLLGARHRAALMAEEDFAALPGVVCSVATEDGSAGHRGLVTELLESLLAADTGAAIYACGPRPMMRRAAALAHAAGRDCYVSLEGPMACGIGLCLGCAVPRRGGGFALLCRDGPVFRADALAWEDAP